jgi:hypothetical protein
LDVDTIERVIESERQRVGRIVSSEIDAILKPDRDRARLEKYMATPEPLRDVLLKGERGPMERLRRRLLKEV